MATKLTPARLAMLRDLAQNGERFIGGVDVRVAHALGDMVKVEDFGVLRKNGRSDGERFYASITNAGRRALGTVAP